MDQPMIILLENADAGHRIQLCVTLESLPVLLCCVHLESITISREQFNVELYKGSKAR